MPDHTPGTGTPLPRLEVRDELGELTPDWDRLVEIQPRPSAFLGSWWIDEVAQGQLCVLACFDGDDLVGGAALEYDWVEVGGPRVPRLRMAGQGTLAPDHLDLIAAPGAHRGVATVVTRWLRRRGSRIVDLDGLAADGTLATVFAPSVVDRIAAPFASLAGGAEAYLADRPGKLRTTIQRSGRRLDKAGITMRTVDAGDPRGATPALAALAELHDHRWSDESTFLRAWTRFAPAAAAGVEQGRVQLHLLCTPDDEVVAVELDLQVGDSVAFYQAGRRTDREWRGAGSVLRARIIADATAAGAAEYDLLRGDEPYKGDWATGRRELVRVHFGTGVLGRAAVAGAALRAQLARRRARRGGDEVA